jgi:hypothetical protein
VEDGLIIGRNTVIGRNVRVLPGAVLTLDTTDIIPPTESQVNKFTPAQAWAAADQGHLVIGRGGSVPGIPQNAYADALTLHNYTVADLLNGVSPSASRTYTVTSGYTGAEELYPNIPAGAYILTRAIPNKTQGDVPLTVSGWLITNGYLSGITKIEVKNGGGLVLTEPSNDLLTGLTELILGPGATLEVTQNGTAVTLKALEKLFLGDGSTIVIPNTYVTFKADTPVVTTVGKNVTYALGLSPAAKVDTVIKEDGGLIGNSTLTVHPGSTFTVAEDVTFTVEDGSILDLSNLPIPATPGTAPVTINGTINIANDGFIVGPSYSAIEADPENLYNAFNLEDGGKVLLDYGATFYLGDDTRQFVGDTAATYTWRAGGVTDGAQIELNQSGMIIRDLNGVDTTNSTTIANTSATVTINAPGSGVLKDQSLYLDRGAILTVAAGVNNALWFVGDTLANGGGAKLLGPGKVAAGTIEIIGGDDGWQAFDDVVAIITTGASASTLSAPTTASIFRALGSGAAIRIPAAGALTIAPNTTVELNGTNVQERGVISFMAGTAAITLANDTSKIFTGASPEGHVTPVKLADDNASVVATNTFTAIGILNLKGDNTGYTLTKTTAAPDLPNNRLPAGRLFSLTGTAGNPGTATADAAVTIGSLTPTDDV